MDSVPADLAAVDMHVVVFNGDLPNGQDSAMYGSSCATMATSVAAIRYVSQLE